MQYACALADLEELVPRLVELEGRPVAIVRVEDDVFAFDPTCTHKPGPLADGAVTRKRTILCPWHLGTFDLRTGAAMAGPPLARLRTFAVRLEDGGVYVRA